MTNPRHTAGLDQAAAFLRDSRKELLRSVADYQRRNDRWYENPVNVGTVLLYLEQECANREQVRDTIRWVTSEAWKYRPEFVVARCRLLDAK